jgi:chromosome partitioning protein
VLLVPTGASSGVRQHRAFLRHAFDLLSIEGENIAARAQGREITFEWDAVRLLVTRFDASGRAAFPLRNTRISPP